MEFEIQSMLENTMIVWTIVGSAFLLVIGFYAIKVSRSLISACKTLVKYLNDK